MKRVRNARTLEHYHALIKAVKVKCERCRKQSDSDTEVFDRVLIRLDLVLRLSKNTKLFEAVTEREAGMFFEYVCDWALSGGRDDVQLHGNC